MLFWLGIAVLIVLSVMVASFGLFVELIPKLRFAAVAKRGRCRVISKRMEEHHDSGVRVVLRVVLLPQTLPGRETDAFLYPPSNHFTEYWETHRYRADAGSLLAGKEYPCWVDVKHGVVAMERRPRVMLGVGCIVAGLLGLLWAGSLTTGILTMTVQ